VSPDFDELFADDEATPEELAELRTVHDLLLSASPPPPLPRRLTRAPRVARPRRRWLPRRHVRATLALVAAAGTAAAFALGYTLGGTTGFQPVFSRTMVGLAPVAGARATIDIGRRDPSGNWPLRMTVRGLPPLPRHDWYQLYLTKKGEPSVLCGVFQTRGGSITHVQMNAPDDLKEYSGWVVTAHVPGRAPHPLLTTLAVS
jgi:hypothetical protein